MLRPMNEESPALPLTGVRVINAGQILAAPFCATLLGEFGAEVIKVERPGTGEPNHGSLSYVQDNRGAKGVTLNLAVEAGRDLFRRLCATADVLLENFRAGTLEKWGLAPDTLREHNPGLVVVRVSGFGQTGPYSERAGFDRVALGFGGMTYVTGTAEGPPVRPGYMVADYSSGLFAAFGAMAALRAREMGGPGQDVDVALYESIWRQSGIHAAQYGRSGKNRERSGNYFPGVVPAEQFETADGYYLIINATTQGTFERLCRAMGREELIDDPRFGEERRKHHEPLHAIVGEWVATFELDDVQGLLDAHGVPATKAYATSDIIEDLHYKAREQVLSVESEQFGSTLQPGIVPRLSSTPGRVAHRAPTLGEHNAEIYGGLLGLTEDEMRAFEAEGVI